MQVTKEEIAVRTLKVTVQVDEEIVKQGFRQAFKEIAKKVKVPGFRPGQAPRAVLERMIETKAVQDEAAEEIVRATLQNILKEHDITVEPTVQPQVSVTTLTEDPIACTYEATISLPPVVELGEYKGLPIEEVDASISDEEVEKQIDDMRRRRASRETVSDRGAENDDMVVVNIKPDDLEARTFMVVVGKTFDALDDILRGMTAEQMKLAELDFPADFQQQEWAGQKLKVQINVNSVSTLRLPELNDEFASKLEADTVGELKDQVRDYLSKVKEEAMRELVNEKALDALLAKSKVEVPPAMAEQLAYRRLSETEAELREKGGNLRTYAEQNGMTFEQLIEAWKEKAHAHVCRALLIRDIFGAEKMQINEDDLREELYAMSIDYGMPPQDLLEMLQRNNAMEELHFRSISRKVTKFLYDNGNKTAAVEAPAKEKKPAKAKK